MAIALILNSLARRSDPARRSQTEAEAKTAQLSTFNHFAAFGGPLAMTIGAAVSLLEKGRMSWHRYDICYS